MVDEKNNISTNIGLANSVALLSDETIDEIGYATYDTTVPVTQSIALSSMVVTGPTKSPPPVLMPRPRPAIHPTFKLTNAFANPEPVVSPTPSPSANLQQDDYPEQPPSTYLTPPLAPILKPVATPTSGGLSEPSSKTQQKQEKQQQQQQTKEETPQQQISICGTAPSTTPSASPAQPIISARSIGDDSNLNHHRISNTTGMATQQQSNQSEEQDNGQNQHSSTTLTTSNDDARPHGEGLVKKSGIIALTSSTSAPLVPSPLVKSTLASQLSSSSSSSTSSGEERQQRQQEENEKESQRQQRQQPQQDQKEKQHRQQRRLRKSLSTEQLSKVGQSDFQHSDSSANQHHQQHYVPLAGGTRPPTVEKLLYNGSSGKSSSLQQLQQEYLLRQNGYLRRQVDALKFDNIESQRQHLELETRMKQLEIQLLEEKKRQTPQQQNRQHEPLMATNEYQHHHYYHHNVFTPPPPMDNYHSSEDDEEDMDQGTKDMKERDTNNDTTTKMRPSGHQTYDTEDGKLLDQRQRVHNGYGKSMEEGLPGDDQHYMERHQGFIPATTSIATSKKSQQQTMNQYNKRPLLDQRRHSSHIVPIPSTSDSASSTIQQQQQQRPRQRHVTAPTLPHHYHVGGSGQGQGQQDQRGWNRQRSRSVPKNEHLHPSSHSHYQQQQQGDSTYRGKPIFSDSNNSNPPRHHRHPKGSMLSLPRTSHFGLQGPVREGADENMEMDSDEELEMAPRSGFGTEDDYYYDEDDEDDYLDELDYYNYHMTAAPGPPPMMYYPPPHPDAFFNDPYATIPPMAPPPPPPPYPLPLHRRKSASALRSSRAVPPGYMDVMNPDHYERPPRPSVRRNWNNPQANQVRQMHMTPSSPRQQQQQHQHERRGYRGDPVSYGLPRSRGPPPPATTTMPIAPAPSSRSGAIVDHHLPRKPPAMTSPRMTTLPLRRPMVTRGSSIGSYPGRV